MPALSLGGIRKSALKLAPCALALLLVLEINPVNPRCLAAAPAAVSKTKHSARVFHLLKDAIAVSRKVV